MQVTTYIVSFSIQVCVCVCFFFHLNKRYAIIFNMINLLRLQMLNGG